MDDKEKIVCPECGADGEDISILVNGFGEGGKYTLLCACKKFGHVNMDGNFVPMTGDDIEEALRQYHEGHIKLPFKLRWE